MTSSKRVVALIDWSFFSDPYDSKSGIARFRIGASIYSHRFDIQVNEEHERRLVLQQGDSEMLALLLAEVNKSLVLKIRGGHVSHNSPPPGVSPTEPEVSEPRGLNSVTFTNPPEIRERDLREMLTILVKMLGGSVSITLEDLASMGTSGDLEAIKRDDGTVILKVSGE